MMHVLIIFWYQVIVVNRSACWCGEQVYLLYLVNLELGVLGRVMRKKCLLHPCDAKRG